MDKKDKKERIIIPIICLLMSIGLWFYVSNVENTIRTYDLKKVPVELLNTDTLRDSNLVLAPNQEFYVDLKLEGSSQIYKIAKEDFKITVDIGEYVLKKGENKMAVNIVSAPSDVILKNKSNLYVVINLEQISEKTMDITSELEITSESGYFISPVEINPKDVKVSGAQSIVDRIDAVVIRGQIKDATENIVTSYPIIVVDAAGKEVEGVDLNIKNVEVVIKVSKGKSVPLKVNTIGDLPAGINLKSIEPLRKTIEIIGAKEFLDNVVEIETEPIDLSTIKENTEISVRVIRPNGINTLYGEEFINVKVNITKMISKELEIKYTVKGLEEGWIFTPQKDTVTVKVTAYEDKIDTITAENIKADFNIESFKEEGLFEGTPVITLIGLDSNVSVIPTEKISFKIEKKVTPPVVETPRT